MLAPCKDCQARHPHCHSECPDYLEFKKAIEETHKKQRFHQNLVDMEVDRKKKGLK